MSAFLVGKKHIDLLVTAVAQANADASGLLRRAGYGTEGEILNAVGQDLWNENRRSLGALYGQLPIASIYVYSRVFEPDLLRPVQILKAIDCYQYQACEHAGWERSRAKRLCDQLRSYYVGRLPGYEHALWEVA